MKKSLLLVVMSLVFGLTAIACNKSAETVTEPAVNSEATTETAPATDNATGEVQTPPAESTGSN